MANSGLRYNEVRQKSVHNAFQKREGIYDQILYWRVRSIEVDLHHSKALQPSLDGDWYVYHGGLDLITTVETLTAFLDLCVGAQNAMPQHEVMTLFLDLKNPLDKRASDKHSAKKLDHVLEQKLGDHLYRPADLLARSPAATTLQQAIAQADWPTLAELRGKFIVVLTGNSKELENYAKTSRTANSRTAFVSGNLKVKADIDAGASHMIFFNMNGSRVHLAKYVHKHEPGFVGRAYYIDDEKDWDAAVLKYCHHLATDKVNSAVDDWATTSQPDGYPFGPLEPAASPGPELGEVAGIWADSQDMWEDKDNFFFAYRDCPDNHIDNEYVFALSSPNSHLESDWVKAGVIARDGLLAGSRYFGVFRIGQKQALRVQYRHTHNGNTTREERLIGSDVDHDRDTLVYVKLRISNGGRTAAAWGSVTGGTAAAEWTSIYEMNFDHPNEAPAKLKYQGLGVSAHGQDGGVKFIVGVPHGGPRPPFNRTKSIRSSREPKVKGWIDWVGKKRWRVDRFDR